MEEQLVGTLTHSEYKAEVFSTSLPGEFRVVYRDSQGKPVHESMLTGISSYRQREHEIMDQLSELAHGVPASRTPDLGDAGEY